MKAPLCVLAIDQRGWLTDALYGAHGRLTDDRLAELSDIKLAVAQGAANARAAGVPGEVGLLVDERYGAVGARHALDAGVTLAMPIELDRQAVLTPEYGDDWLPHLQAFGSVIAKLLIWHNVETDRATLDAQLERLAAIAGEIKAAGLPHMLEILAPATPEQLARVDGDRDRFDRELLPELTLAAIDEVAAAGVPVDMWKLEGMPDAGTFGEVRVRCEQGAPGSVCLVLGRNETPERVDRWLTEAAAGGFGGFAIGRSVWWQPVRDWRDGSTDRATAVARISENYAHVCEVFAGAMSPARPL